MQYKSSEKSACDLEEALLSGASLALVIGSAVVGPAAQRKKNRVCRLKERRKVSLTALKNKQWDGVEVAGTLDSRETGQGEFGGNSVAVHRDVLLYMCLSVCVVLLSDSYGCFRTALLK